MGEVDYRAIENKLNQYCKMQRLIDLYTMRLERLTPNFLIGAPKIIKGHSDDASGGQDYSTEGTLKRIKKDFITRQQVYAHRIKIMVDKQDAFIDMLAISPLDEEELEYIMLRYVEGKSVKKICRECHYSENTALRIKNKALEKLADNGGLDMLKCV
jgi:hypothetical protein